MDISAAEGESDEEEKEEDMVPTNIPLINVSILFWCAEDDSTESFLHDLQP